MGDNPFWRYSLKTYGKPGVQAAALALQDGFDLDVNLLLFCCWAGACGHRLSEREIESLEAACASWREEVVRPLRRARRHLKPLETEADVADLRAAIKKSELEAERLQQDRLHAVLPLSTQDVRDAAHCVEAARANLGGYGALAGGRPVDFSDFLAACFQE